MTYRERLKECLGYDPLACPDISVLKQHIRAGDVVMDVGAYIGELSMYAVEHGAKAVAYEPRRELTQLLSDYGVEVVNAAVVSDPEILKAGHIEFASSRSDMMFSSVFKRTRNDKRTFTKVPVIDFQSELQRVQPHVLKLDIEGGEWSLDLSTLPDSLRFIDFEYHMFKLKPRDELVAYDLEERLLSLGFEVVDYPDFHVQFGTHGRYVRNT